MKNYILIIIVSLGILIFKSCTPQVDDPVINDPPVVHNITACGVRNPAKNLLWLAELIETAKKDTTAKYLGTIWLEKYQEQDVFVVNMTLGSEIYTYHTFDCQGNKIVFEDRESKKEFLTHLKKEIVIYTKPIVACGVANPATHLPWLAELIEKAETDKTMNFLGFIWLVNYKGQDLFVTNMMLNSGAARHWIFDCVGNHIGDVPSDEWCSACYCVGHHHFDIEDEDFADFENTLISLRDVVIYSPINYYIYE